MKCYLCNKSITKAVRKWMDAKDHRYKDGFKDLCCRCYDEQMQREGYEKTSHGNWMKPAKLLEAAQEYFTSTIKARKAGQP